LQQHVFAAWHAGWITIGAGHYRTLCFPCSPARLIPLSRFFNVFGFSGSLDMRFSRYRILRDVQHFVGE